MDSYGHSLWRRKLRKSHEALMLEPRKTSKTKMPLSALSSVALAAACCVARGGDQPPVTATPSVSVQTPITPPGLLNEVLRQQSPAFTPWDFGGQFRARYEIKENGG